MLLDICLVYLPGPVFCFFKIEVTESFEIPKIRPVARVPVQSIANFTTCLRTSGSYAFLVYSSTKLYRSHAGLLHRYTCFPALLCPFLLTLSLPQCGHLIVNVFVAIPLPTFPFSLFSFFVTSLQFLKDITQVFGIGLLIHLFVLKMYAPNPLCQNPRLHVFRHQVYELQTHRYQRMFWILC